MCGIVGILGKAPAAPLLLDGLKRLEYRGYDSAGIATLVNGRIERRRAEGKLDKLEALLDDRPLHGAVGIGHTRWATHGMPNETNAHPHANDRVAVVHNGIIENFADLRAELEAEGHVFETETDSEVVVHLITDGLNRQLTPQQAVAAALKRLEGAFALAIVFAGCHDLMIGARRGSPLAIGYGDGEMYVGSDALALAPFTDRICYLEEGDWAELTPQDAIVHDASDAVVAREVRQTALTGGGDWQGPVSPLHAEGDLRAAGGDRRHPACLHQPAVTAHHAARSALRPGRVAPGDDQRLRDGLLCRHGRQILVRADRAPTGRDRHRLRVPLPRGAPAGGRPVAVHLPVGRDRGHLGRASLCPRPRPAGAVDRQTCPRARSRASPRPCCRPWRGRRSVSLRPRPSPRS